MLSYKRAGDQKFHFPAQLPSEAEFINTGLDQDTASVLITGEKLVKFEQLRKCIEEGNTEELNDLLLTPSEEIEILDWKTNVSVLHVAAKYDNEEIVNILLSKDIVKKLINVTDRQGVTPLMLATLNVNIKVALLFLKRGANIFNENLMTKKTVLHYASVIKSTEILDELLKLSQDTHFINKQDANGSTPLMLAVISDSECVHSLLSNKADIMKTNNLKRNILHFAVLYKRYKLLSEFVEENENLHFLDQLDVNGDSPLMLAIRMGDIFIFDSLLESRLAPILIQRCQPTLHYLLGKKYCIEKMLQHISDPSYFDFTDDSGRPFLIYAAEQGDVELIELLVKHKASLNQKNRFTGDTVLHVAAAANNRALLNSLLKLADISEIINEQNNMGQTAYEKLLEKGDHQSWLRFYKSGFVGADYFNNDHESALFIAAKNGNYELILSLLLSKEFFDIYAFPSLITANDIILNEMKCDIFPTDVFTVLGIQTVSSPWCFGPSQDHLFEYNCKGQNIFHACALGNSIECTKFIYEYIVRFVKCAEDFDNPDITGDTPLMFTLKYSTPEMTKFFLKHKADFGFKNSSGKTSLDIIIENISEYDEILYELLNECALIDSKVRLQGLSYGQLTLEYDVLCPTKHNQMYFFEKIFCNVSYSEIHDRVLSHPVIEYFVLYKWARIRDAVGQRFFFNTMSVAVFSIYLSYSLCDFLNIRSTQFSLLWWITLILSLRSFLYNLPLCFIYSLKPVFHMVILLISPILIIIFLQINNQKRLTLEIGAVAALSSWLSVFFQGIHTRISFQIAMFSEVLSKVISYLPICFVIVLAFSNCFFTLFNNYVEFNNPFHAFIQTSTLLLQGQFDVPIIQNDIEPFDSSFTMFNPMEKDKVNGVKDTRNMLVEGSIVLLFEVLVTICLLNMLIGLAVRSSEEIVLEGQIQNIRTYIREISSWEQLAETSFYEYFSRLGLDWLFGIPPKLKDILKAPTTIYPLQETYFNFDVYRLKAIAVEIDQITSTKMKFFLDITEKSKELSSAVLSERRAAGLYSK